MAKIRRRGGAAPRQLQNPGQGPMPISQPIDQARRPQPRPARAAANAPKPKTGGPLRTAPAPAPQGGRVLGQQQRQKFEQIRQTQGQQAAADFRAGVAQKKGIELPPPGQQRGGGMPPGGQGLSKRQVRQINNINPKRPGQALQTEADVEQFESEQQVGWQNPDVNNPFGSQTTEIGPDGKPVVTQKLDPNQQKIADQDAYMSQLGRSLAESQITGGTFDKRFDPNLDNRYGTGDLAKDRSRIEQETYGYLTRDMADTNKRAEDSLAQRLAIKGIDPNSDRAKREWQNLRDSQARERGDARYQAVSMGGQELERNFGMGEQRRANQLSEQLATRGQQLGEINQFSNMGPGLRAPEFQPYQAPGYELPGAIETSTGLGQYGLAKKLANAELAKKRPQGGNTGVAGPPAVESPFYSGLPPGF